MAYVFVKCNIKKTPRQSFSGGEFYIEISKTSDFYSF